MGNQARFHQRALSDLADDGSFSLNPNFVLYFGLVVRFHVNLDVNVVQAADAH